MNPAVTIYFLAGGTAVQAAGLEIPLEQQVEALNLASQINASPVPGAIRGEVWTSGKVAASSFFDPGSSITAEVEAAISAAAEAAANAPAETNPSQEVSVAGSEAHTLVSEGSTPSPATNEPTAGAEGTPGAPEASAPASAPLVGKKKTPAS